MGFSRILWMWLEVRYLLEGFYTSLVWRCNIFGQKSRTLLTVRLVTLKHDPKHSLCIELPIKVGEASSGQTIQEQIEESIQANNKHSTPFTQTLLCDLLHFFSILAACSCWVG